MDIRATITLDFSVPDGTDPDEFHDSLRIAFDHLDESDLFQDDGAGHYVIDATREISVTEVTEL